MLKRREDLSNIIVAIDDLAKHPPDTPMRELLLDLLHQVSTDSPLRAEAEGIIVRLENE